MGFTIRLLLTIFLCCSCGGNNSHIDTMIQSHYENGINALGKKDYLTAEKELKIALAKNNRHIAAYAALGDIYLNWGRLDEAQNNYNRALKIDPNFAQAHIGLVKLQLKKDNTKEALSILQDIFQITENYAEAYYLKGLIYLKKNNSLLAIEEFQKALTINSQHTLAQLKLKEAQEQKQINSYERIDLYKKERVSRAEIACFLVNNLNLKARRIVHETQIYDIKNHKAEKEIQRIVNLRIMQVEDHKFYPKKLITRSVLAQIGQALIIWSSGDQSLSTTFSYTSTPFSDVFPGDSYYNAVLLSTSYGLLEPPSDGKFKPLVKVSGNEAIQFLENVKQLILH